MEFQIDHDLHLHSFLSICSDDENQVPAAMLQKAKEQGLRTICITDHYWDENVPCNTRVNWWYEKQNHAHISSVLPLPQDPEVRFLFGCEADMDSDDRIGLSPAHYDDFDFIIVSTTHLHHMTGERFKDLRSEEVGQRWVERMDTVLDSDLPLHKVGIAHLSCSLIDNRTADGYLNALRTIPDAELSRVFTKAAKKGVGIEFNYSNIQPPEESREVVLRIFRTAKECGCKFYLGSDAHSQEAMVCDPAVFQRILEELNITEEDKFIIP